MYDVQCTLFSGGPLREFLYIYIFCGPQDCRVPSHNIPEVLKNTFYHVGQMIAVSLVHGGPSPSFFSDTVADYIANGMTGLKPSVSSVPDPEMQSKIAKVCTCQCILNLTPVHVLLIKM